MPTGEASATARAPAEALAKRPREESTGAMEAALARERLLVRRLRSGDQKAFAEMVRAFQDRVFNLTVRMLGDFHEAEDLAQEVFVALHGALADFRGESRLSTWIFRVTRNHCLNRLKYLSRRERGRSSDISRVPESDLGRSREVLAPDEAVAAAEQRTLVRRAMEDLQEEHRLLVVLRDIEGLSYDEIAAVTDQPEGTVKSRLHRARAALAAAMAKLEDSSE